MFKENTQAETFLESSDKKYNLFLKHVEFSKELENEMSKLLLIWDLSEMTKSRNFMQCSSFSEGHLDWS